MIRRACLLPLLAVALPAAPQGVPAADYSDMWWNPAESGWGVSIAQHAGTAFVTNGMPFSQSGSSLRSSPVGTFTFDFATASTATFTYGIAAPAGLAANDPAYDLPAMAGSKAIQRQVF